MMRSSKSLIRILSLVLLSVIASALFSFGYSEESSEEQAVSEPSYAGSENLKAVPFLTLRNRTGSDKASKYFGGERGHLQAGLCNVIHTPLTPLKSIADKASFYIPRKGVSDC